MPFLLFLFPNEFDKAYITDLNSINQHIYNKLLVRCFVFHVLEKNFQRLYILEDFSLLFHRKVSCGGRSGSSENQ